MKFLNYAMLTACLLVNSSLALAENANPYLQELISRSHALGLASRLEWLNLLHYKPYPFWPGSRSLADDPDFFNSKNGMHDAGQELDATLAAFFSDQEETGSLQNPQCRFIARYYWLNEQLHFDPARLRPHECKRYEKWHQAINPQEVTLVFPAAYINSRASMYGHTLLRIDAKDQDERTRLLAYTVGYTAGTSETNGLLFAVQGLTGGYPGIFQIMPYYLKVREYSDMENRDIWEYRLNLDEVEVERMMRHVWELAPTYFDYYFFDENCAYHLLSLLEVARPGLELTDKFRWYAIPSETVRAVTEQPGLVKQVVFRPANATQINHLLKVMKPEMRNLALGLSKGAREADDAEIVRLPQQDQAEIMELGEDYLTYMQAGQGEKPELASRMRKLQLARSSLQADSGISQVLEPESRPEQGHPSLRAGLGGGNRDGVPYQEIEWRPAYHELNDPVAGYVPGAEIQFFNLRLRHYGEEGGLRVEEFTPIDIFSLASRNDFFQPVSWKVDMGWLRKRMSADNDPLIMHLNAGVGYAWDAPSMDNRQAQTYVMLDSSLETASQYHGSYALGAGPEIGIMKEIGGRWNINVRARMQRFFLGELHTVGEAGILQRFTIGKNSALKIELLRKAEFDQAWTDANIVWQEFFE